VLLLLATLVAFGGSLFHGFALIDDHFLVTQNLAIRGVNLENLKTIFTTFDPELYIPLTILSFQLNYLVGGLDPFGFHLTNLLIHATNALLVFWVLLLLTKRRGVAMFCGMLFAVHPLFTQVVVWITGRKDLLSTFFYLLSFATYLLHRSGGRKTYVASILFFFLALYSKVIVVTLPVVLILYEVLLKREKNTMRWIAWKTLPYFILSVLFLVVAVIGKERIVGDTNLLETLVMGSRSIVFYIEKLLVPVSLGLFYPYRGEIGLLKPLFLASSVFVAALLIVAILARARARWLTFGILAFLVTLAPTFFNFKTGDLIYVAADRYAYLPSVFLFFVLARAVAGATRNGVSRVLVCVGAFILVLFTALSYKQTQVWATPESLFSHSLRLHPESITARTALARVYRESGKLEEAFEVLKEGLRYDDDYRLHLGAASVYARSGQVAEAREQTRIAMEMEPENPEPLAYMGDLEEQMGDRKAAMGYYEKAIALDPSYVAPMASLGNLYIGEGRMEEAKELFTKALKWNGSWYEAHIGMAKVLEKEGDLEGMERHLKKATALMPDAPWERVSHER
jgi:Tfp pilus assembly protein PilF